MEEKERSAQAKRNSLSSSEMDANEMVSSSGEDILSSKDSLNSIASIKVSWFHFQEKLICFFVCFRKNPLRSFLSFSIAERARALPEAGAGSAGSWATEASAETFRKLGRVSRSVVRKTLLLQRAEQIEKLEASASEGLIQSDHAIRRSKQFFSIRSKRHSNWWPNQMYI